MQQLVEIARRGGGVVHPFAQQRAAVDHVDGEALVLVFVGEVAPQRVVRIQAADGLEGQRIEAPGAEGGSKRNALIICTLPHKRCRFVFGNPSPCHPPCRHGSMPAVFREAWRAHGMRGS